MKIKNVEIKNFRSVLSTEFNLSSDVTAFAGGNESGKSNILFALQKFLLKKNFDESDTYQLSSDLPNIKVTFYSFTAEELSELGNYFGKVKINELVINRQNNEYSIVSPTLKVPKPEEKVSEASLVTTELSETNDQTSETSTAVEGVSEESPAILTVEEITNNILQLLPKVEYIGYLESVIIGENISISEIYPSTETKIKKDKNEKLETIRALLKLGNIREEDVRNSDLSKRTKLLQRGAAVIGEHLRKSWKQEDIKLKIVADSESLVILFRDGKNRPDEADQSENDAKWIWTLPEDRSTGFRWYVTFFAKYLSKLENSKNVLFLIDDAGGPLNKIAQENLLKELISRANNETSIQIIYTTHSNHMVNWDFRSNIRLVEKQHGTGTKVIDMWWKNYSPDKLPSPLQEIGFVWDEDILKRDNLVLEGLTDVYILHNLPIKFVPEVDVNPYEGFKLSMAGSASEIENIGQICKLRKKRAFLLYDSDPKGISSKTKAEVLKENKKLDLDIISNLSPNSQYKIETIEDLLPVTDFLTHLNKYGKNEFKTRWNDIQILQNVGDEGVLSLIQKRLIANGLEKKEIDIFFKKYKYIIDIETTNSVSIESYKKIEQKQAIIELFNSIQNRLKILKTP